MICGGGGGDPLYPLVQGGGWMVVVKKGATFYNGNGCIRSGPFLESTVVSVLKRETGEEE